MKICLSGKRHQVQVITPTTATEVEELCSRNYPFLVRVNELWLRKRKGDVAQRYNGNFVVLFGHSSSSTGPWRFDDGTLVSDRVKEIESRGISIDALFVCNRGDHSLPEGYTYVKGSLASGGFSIDKSGNVHVLIEPSNEEGCLVCPRIRVLK